MKTTILAAAVVAVLALSACSRDYGFTRSAFNSKFVDKTEEAAIGSAGQPDRVETPDPDTHVLVYSKKTFDQENGNAKDALAKVTFRKDAAGKYVYAGIDFQPE